MAKQRVDFRHIKETVSIEALVARYGVELRKSGKSLRGGCPLPCGEEGGKSCFSVNPGKRVFHCFHKGCGWSGKKGGDVLELVKAIEGVSLREAGVKLSEWFGGANGVGECRDCTAARTAEPGVINPPLGFELKAVDRQAALSMHGAGDCRRRPPSGLAWRCLREADAD